MIAKLIPVRDSNAYENAEYVEPYDSVIMNITFEYIAGLFELRDHYANRLSLSAKDKSEMESRLADAQTFLSENIMCLDFETSGDDCHQRAVTVRRTGESVRPICARHAKAYAEKRYRRLKQNLQPTYEATKLLDAARQEVQRLPAVY